MRGRNQRTSHPSEELASRRRPLEAKEAFRVAYDTLRGLARSARGPAVLVAAVDSQACLVGAMHIEHGQSLNIGRHTHCGLWLPTESVSLRHLVAYARSESPEAAPVIRLWDLHTEQPFITEDGQSNAAVVARGLLYAAVGEYALLFVPSRGPAEPSWPREAGEAWEALPARRFIDRRAPTAPQRHFGWRWWSGRYPSEVSREGPPRTLSESGEGEVAWAELRLSLGPVEETYRFSRDMLGHGVLVGRYERCGVALGVCRLVSRVHLLLVRVGEDVLAIDTASSNGTWREVAEVGTIVLGEVDSLNLANQVRLDWRRLRAHNPTDRGL
jgi:hypothetical protein